MIGQFCFPTCGVGQSCDDAAQSCQGGTCLFTTCDAHLGFGTVCDSSGSGSQDGTCTPFFVLEGQAQLDLPDGGNFGICYKSGHALIDGACAVDPVPRTDIDRLCPVGAICDPYSGSEGICQVTCDVNAAGQNVGDYPACPAGSYCDEVFANFGACSPGAADSGQAAGNCAPLSGDGGRCITSVDCEDSLVCSQAYDGGSCVAPSIPTIVACSSSGAACGLVGDAPCCGFCVGGQCKDLDQVPCASTPGASCTGASDCCLDLACVDGSCQPTCGQENAACDPAHGSGDCCIGLGFTCQGYGLDAGAPYECNNIYSFANLVSCMPYCSVRGPSECELGSPCSLGGTPGMPVDPCAAAGLVCDADLNVCARPSLGSFIGEPCLPGGPACGGPTELTNSNVKIVCVPDAGRYGNLGPLCLELCQSTKDCLLPGDACDPDQFSPPACQPSDSTSATCTKPFQACDSAGSADGLCELNYSGGPLCVQRTLDGGGPGSACSIWAIRENPAFCDTADFCNGGLCVPVCNAGTSKPFPPVPNPVCPAGQRCVDAYARDTDSADMGFCVTNCDFLSDGGGGCVPPDGGVPQVCLPDLIFGTDDDGGICGAGIVNPLPIGAPCTPYVNGTITPSPCVAGALCLNPPAGGNICTRICMLGTKCPGGAACQPINLAAGEYSTVTGACYMEPDAG